MTGQDRGERRHTLEKRRNEDVLRRRDQALQTGQSGKAGAIAGEGGARLEGHAGERAVGAVGAEPDPGVA